MRARGNNISYITKYIEIDEWENKTLGENCVLHALCISCLYSISNSGHRNFSPSGMIDHLSSRSGRRVFLVPFLYFRSNFWVHPLANELPRIVIQRSHTIRKSSTLYFSYLGGIPEATSSYLVTMFSDDIISSMTSLRRSVPGIYV